MPTLQRFGAVGLHAPTPTTIGRHFMSSGPDFQVPWSISSPAVIAGGPGRLRIAAAVAWKRPSARGIGAEVGRAERARMTKEVAVPKVLPRIADVAPDKLPLTLRVRWQHGESLVDVSGVRHLPRVCPLREDRTVPPGSIERRDGRGLDRRIDIAASTLWRWRQERSGNPDYGVPCQRERKAYTLDRRPGRSCSRRMVPTTNRTKADPRTVALVLE
jgi:hypothetical protein